MPRRKNWRRSEARRSVLERSSNYQTGLTPESTQNVLQTESVMIKALFDSSPVSVQAPSPVSVQAPSPVSVQAQTRNKHSQYNLKNKDVQTKLQNQDENKDCQTDLQNKDCEMNMIEKCCQMGSLSTDHNTFLHNSSTSTFSDILTKTQGPCLTEFENGSQPFQQFSFSTLSEVDTTQGTCITKPVNDNIWQALAIIVLRD